MTRMKGLKSEWKKFVLEDTKKDWNEGVIKIKEKIYQNFRIQYGKNKYIYLEKVVENLGKIMNTTKCTL